MYKRQRLSDGLNALAQRQQAIEAWAREEPARVAAMALLRPAPTTPNGTLLTFYPPSLAPAPSTPPLRSAQPLTFQSPAAAPALDPWAVGRAAQTAQESPGGPRHFDLSTPGGGGKGGYPYPR